MNSSRTRLVALLGGIAAVAAWFWYSADFNCRFQFLPAHSPAEWIVYPTPPNAEMHTPANVWTVFEREFVAPISTNAAQLEIRAFKAFSVYLNGNLLSGAGKEQEWKRATSVDLSPLLQPGTNLLSVVVTNRNGPPALWAAFQSADLKFHTDTSWKASIVGAIQQPAMIAGNERPIQKGHPLFGIEKSIVSVGKVIWFWLIGGVILLFAVSAEKVSSLFSNFIARCFSVPRRTWILLGIVGVLWFVLFFNNLPHLPSLLGFDTDGHTEYIRFVQTHGRLPLADEGWQMYQPPLYYLLSVGWLELFGLSMEGEVATLALRALSGLIGMVHLAFLFSCLRRIFPIEKTGPVIGLFFAASLPPLVCTSQYITNEGLAAAMSTGALYFALRTTQTRNASLWLWIASGGFLGLALLSKFSAVVLAPFLFVFLAWHSFKLTNTGITKWRGILCAALACAVICGWHYVRVWARFGNPLVGNWSPESGFSWWQENGFTTPHYFWSFGRSLTTPLFSGYQALGDGFYSTLWADGLCSGGAKAAFRPPWNYALMTAGVWLALFPSLLIILGGLRLTLRWVRNAALENLLWPGLLAAYGLAIAAMTLRVPSYAQAKAVYGLGALLPLCVCLLAGLESVRAAGKFVYRVCLALLLLWMMNSLASFWIQRNAAMTHEMLVVNHFALDRWTEGLKEAELALAREPQDAVAAVQRARALRLLGRNDEALVEAEKVRAQHGLESGIWMELAAHAVARGDTLIARNLAAEAATLLPDDPDATHDTALWSWQSGQIDDAVMYARKALRIRFSNPQLHYILAKALAAQGHDAEAVAHLRLAIQLKPDWSTALNDFAWILATHPSSLIRNGNEAVTIAEHACDLTKRQQPQFLGTLAAAYAEAGRFEDAIQAATSAIQLAKAAGQQDLADLNESFLKLYQDHKPYHQTDTAAPAGSREN